MPEARTDKEGQQERRFSQEQYDMLMRCSEKKDIAEWNEWRRANPDRDVLLEGANLSDAHLEGADLLGAWLRSANLSRACLKRARLRHARMQGIRAVNASLERADLNGANMTRSNLGGARLCLADLRRCQLKDADMVGAHLEQASLSGACLEGAELVQTHLQGAKCNHVMVDGRTMIDCYHDQDTDFTAVGLRSARVAPRIRLTLEGNVRRKMWLQWYAKHVALPRPVRWGWWLVTLPVRAFWWMSNYGQSTARIVMSFFVLAMLFALIYGFVPNLVTDLHEVNGKTVSASVLPFRAVYFSIVTMTTLGFGDMYAAPGSITGHVLLTLHVILGYVLLGALVTRLAILFQES